MSAYLYSLGAIAILVSALSFIAWREGERASAAAFGIIMAAAVFVPLSAVLPSVDFSAIIEDIKKGGDELPLYALDSREALEKGIAAAVCDEFSLREGSVSVGIEGFDFEKMRARGIRVTLRGTAVFADIQKIEKFVSELGLGDCEAVIEL